MQTAMESCPTKAVMAGGMGFVLGGAFGLFMSSVSFPKSSGAFSAMNTARHQQRRLLVQERDRLQY